MKYLLILVAMLASSARADQAPPLPIQSGQHTFQLRYSEHPNIRGIGLAVIITGHRISLTDKSRADGAAEEGTLMWHADSEQWIIGHEPSDRFARDVGGCSDGPTVVDLVEKIYWTC